MTALEKGRVERSIRFIRDNFFAARSFVDLDDLNAQADRWCHEQGTRRPWPEDNTLTVGEAFEQEKPTLIGLPDNPFAADERVNVSIGKTPYARYDLNDYSVPHTQVRRTLSVLASVDTVRILDGAKVIASHARQYGKGEQIEDPAHLQALLDYKQQATHQRGQDRLAVAAPESRKLLQSAAQRGYRPGTIVASLLRLLDTYGAQELDAAITEALLQDVPHPNAVRVALERRRDEQNRPPPLAIPLSNTQARNLVVPTGTLGRYDQISGQSETDDDNDTDTDTNNSTQEISDEQDPLH